nr:hypothetical protein [Tanacetum cinerariifolium]
MDTLDLFHEAGGLPRLVCVPEGGIPMIQSMRIVVQSLQAHPESLHLNESSAAACVAVCAEDDGNACQWTDCVAADGAGGRYLRVRYLSFRSAGAGHARQSGFRHRLRRNHYRSGAGGLPCQRVAGGLAHAPRGRRLGDLRFRGGVRIGFAADATGPEHCADRRAADRAGWHGSDSVRADGRCHLPRRALPVPGHGDGAGVERHQLRGVYQQPACAPLRATRRVAHGVVDRRNTHRCAGCGRVSGLGLQGLVDEFSDWFLDLSVSELSLFLLAHGAGFRRRLHRADMGRHRHRRHVQRPGAGCVVGPDRAARGNAAGVRLRRVGSGDSGRRAERLLAVGGGGRIRAGVLSDLRVDPGLCVEDGVQ